MSETLPALAFWLLAAAAVGGALAMVITRNVVHAAFWLLEVMVATAGLFLLLDAEFLALVQILVYAGAVTVLTLFVIMLTLRRREEAVLPQDPVWAGLVVAALFAGMVVLGLARFEPVLASLPESPPGVEAFGEALFTTWALPFEVASLVLLAALVGAVWWAGGDRR